MAPFMFVLLALAAYRVTRLVTRDSLWEHTRDRLADWFTHHRASKAAELLTCPFCAGFWVCALVLAAALAADLVDMDADMAVLVWWALAGAQALLSSVDDRLNG